MSSAGKWNRWYGLLGRSPEPFGDSVTYQLGAEWLAGCAQVADWGCGKGWLRRFVDPARYWGIDGSHSPFADVVADLTVYRSPAPGVFIRHVLEHDYEWPQILDNALAAAQERLFLALFTPLADHTHQIAFAQDPGVPDLSFRLADLTDRIEAAGFGYTVDTLATPTQYGTETVLRCQR